MLNNVAVPPFIRLTLRDGSAGLCITCPLEPCQVLFKAIVRQPTSIAEFLHEANDINPIIAHIIIEQIIAHDRQHLLWRHTSSAAPTYEGSWMIETAIDSHFSLQPSAMGLIVMNLSRKSMYYQLQSLGQITHNEITITYPPYGIQQRMTWWLPKEWRISHMAQT